MLARLSPRHLAVLFFVGVPGFSSWPRGLSFDVLVTEAACRRMGKVDALDMSEGCRVHSGCKAVVDVVLDVGHGSDAFVASFRRCGVAVVAANGSKT